MKQKAEEFEGRDILFYLERDMDSIQDDELTKGRIRTIYVKLKYGHGRVAEELAEYYDLPVEIIKDIGHGKLFREITKDMDGEDYGK